MLVTNLKVNNKSVQIIPTHAVAGSESRGIKHIFYSKCQMKTDIISALGPCADNKGLGLEWYHKICKEWLKI